jgi:hypothetical protein
MKSKRVIILIAVLAFLAAALILREFLFRPGEKLTLMVTEPATYQKDIDPNLKTITFQFNQNIEKLDFSLATFPDFAYQTQAQDNKLLVLPEEPLAGGEEYLIELKEKSSSFYFPLEFTTSYLPSENSNIPEEKNGLGDPKAEEEIAKIVLEGYPLFYQTPKETAFWQADYSQKLEITVTYQASSIGLETVQQEVFAWLKSEGIDPQTHSFKWQPINQSQD